VKKIILSVHLMRHCSRRLQSSAHSYSFRQVGLLRCDTDSVERSTKQKVWPPRSADTVCPPPASNDTGTGLQYWAKTAQTDHVTLRPWPLTLEVMPPVANAYTTCTPSLKLVGLGIRKIWCTMCIRINGLERILAILMCAVIALVIRRL